ncbi:hypothetical protein Leryth_021450 [Lithospermum erythrorhizon]|nr:hypothetical protein Leryth_021450 [Lithospermum erythrorhizon]
MGDSKVSSSFVKTGGTTGRHTISESEKSSYVAHINSYLKDDPFLRNPYLSNRSSTNTRCLGGNSFVVMILLTFEFMCICTDWLDCIYSSCSKLINLAVPMVHRRPIINTKKKDLGSIARTIHYALTLQRPLPCRGAVARRILLKEDPIWFLG